MQRGQPALLLFTRYHHDDKVKEDDTDHACCVKNVCRALIGRAEGKRHRLYIIIIIIIVAIEFSPGGST